MGTSKLTDKLDAFFNLSKSKQKKKHDKLLRIIHKLEEKKSSLGQEVINESEMDETSEIFHDLRKELNIVSKLLKKAKKKSILDEGK